MNDMMPLQSFLHGFPQWLRSALKAAGMSQTELANATGITKAHVSNIINGNVNPSIWTVARIVDVLTDRCREVE